MAPGGRTAHPDGANPRQNTGVTLFIPHAIGAPHRSGTSSWSAGGARTLFGGFRSSAGALQMQHGSSPPPGVIQAPSTPLADLRGFPAASMPQGSANRICHSK
ncbi:hypothetical protein GDO78_023198 [Eleutherodactylus coqui]|uniref:Uncharacterized protein n=1 Tax=Eleutherodactylus coqui TaxID=57060 RepID=A0A8J6E4N1_ELECQ|nr:hypothetical protein GDO78_023198 [Eleutherodactylus coqui]